MPCSPRPFPAGEGAWVGEGRALDSTRTNLGATARVRQPNLEPSPDRLAKRVLRGRAPHSSEVDPRWALQATAANDVRDLRPEADAELGYHPAGAGRRLLGQQLQDGVAVARAVNRHGLSIFHENDEDRHVGVQTIDERQRLLYLVGRLVESSQHECVAIVDAVRAESRARPLDLFEGEGLLQLGE